MAIASPTLAERLLSALLALVLLQPGTGRLEAIEFLGDDGQPVAALTTSLSYQAANGYLSQIDLPNGLTRRFTEHDGQGRVTRMHQEVSGAIAQWDDETWQVERDGQGRITTLTGPEGTTSYTYQDARLTVEERTGAGALRRLYGYDDNDNRTGWVDFLQPVEAGMTATPGAELPASITLAADGSLGGDTLDTAGTAGGVAALSHDLLLGNVLRATVDPVASGSVPVGVGLRWRLPSGTRLQLL
jgi:YD repeat-containing protein